MWGCLEVWSFAWFCLTEFFTEKGPHVFPFSVFWCPTKYFKILLSITFSLSQPLDPQVSQIVILLWIKAAPKENLATQFILQARSGIKIANLLKYSSGTLLLECEDVAAASNASWAFFAPTLGPRWGLPVKGSAKRSPLWKPGGYAPKWRLQDSWLFCLVTSQDSYYQHILVLSTDWIHCTHSQVSLSSEQLSAIHPCHSLS